MPTSRNVGTDAPPEFRQHPLIEFKSLISDVHDRPLNENNPNRFVVIFDCAEVEVIEAREPFSFPVTQIEVVELNFPNTAWAALTESIRNCGFSGDINGLIGKHAHWKFAPVMLNMRIPNSDPVKYENRMGNAWTIVDLEGVSNTTNELFDKVAVLADGKDATGFKSAFMSDMSLQGYTNYAEVAQQVMANTFLDLLVTMGKLSFDGSNYHKV